MKLFQRTSKSIGDSAEEKARNYLIKQGIQILDTNYRCKLGEIDIIAKQDNTLLFVEVKFRKNSKFGSPSEMVTPQKQKRIVKSTQHYLQAHSNLANKACRFDVISIQQNDIEWIKNAFDAF